jgi:hypothetical protein
LRRHSRAEEKHAGPRRGTSVGVWGRASLCAGAGEEARGHAGPRRGASVSAWTPVCGLASSGTSAGHRGMWPRWRSLWRCAEVAAEAASWPLRGHGRAGLGLGPGP